jgi:hypothetical protein
VLPRMQHPWRGGNAGVCAPGSNSSSQQCDHRPCGRSSSRGYSHERPWTFAFGAMAARQARPAETYCAVTTS